MATTKKTKEQLVQEIEELKTKVEKLERFEKYQEGADEMAAMRESFENAGFSREESMKILLGMMNMAAKRIGLIRF